MTKQPSLQAAVVTGLNLLNDPEVRVPANQAEGIASLRLLLQSIASGQLVVNEPATPQVEGSQLLSSGNVDAPAVRKPRAPRRTKAQVNGAAASDATAAPPTVQ